MNEQPSYLNTEKKERSLALPVTLAIVWSSVIALCFVIIDQKLTHQQTPSNPANTSLSSASTLEEHLLSPWILSTSQKIQQIRQLALHLARDYKTVEFLADTSEAGDDISNYWQTFKQDHSYISQIGVVEEETSDHFYVGQFLDEAPSLNPGSEQLLNYWMQVGLLNNNDILFFNFSEPAQGEVFRFTTPVHYEDMRLGHLYIDINVNQLLINTANELASSNVFNNVIMLDKEGNYVAESTTANWSAKQAFEKSLGYYYPEFWQTMNAGLSGQFSTISQNTYFSKLDIPWYGDQIKYFYLIKIADKQLQTKSGFNVWTIAVLLWLIGMISLWLMHRQAKQLS